MPEDRDTTVEQDAGEGAAAVAPVPAPGSHDSSAAAGVLAAQGDAPAEGAAEREEGSSPGAWTAVAARGKPDGEVDTRTGGAG